jgi:hypothetical protein
MAGENLNGLEAWPKHFLYLSVEKIESLYAQLTTRERRKIAQQIEVNLQLVKGSISFEQTPESLYAKLRLVLAHLRREQAVGSVDVPVQYVAGALPMAWGTFGAAEAGVTADVVLFVAGNEDFSLMLGGSLGNVVGERIEGARKSGSHAPSLLDALRTADHDSPEDLLAVRMLRGHESQAVDWELDLIEKGVNTLPGVTQQVEFVARRLIEGVSRDGERRILLASPLYVALVD